MGESLHTSLEVGITFSLVGYGYELRNALIVDIVEKDDGKYVVAQSPSSQEQIEIPLAWLSSKIT